MKYVYITAMAIFLASMFTIGIGIANIMDKVSGTIFLVLWYIMWFSLTLHARNKIKKE